MSALGIGLLGLLVYTYVGYPLVVALWAKIAPCRLRPQQGYEPTVSVCISVHNGATYLRQKLQSLQALDYPAHKLEFLFYSDGSTDDTERLVAELSASEPRLRLLRSEARLGKPTGLNRLQAAATGEVLLMTDVRQPLTPQALRALLAPLSDPRVGCVSGTLMLAGNTGPGAYWRYEKLIRVAEGQLGRMVGVSGSLYVIRRDDFRELPRDVLLDDMFVPLSTVGQRKRVVLARDAEAYDEAYADEREFGRKARTLAGNYQLLSKLPWLLLPFRNPVWFELVSHKLLRLACPFALMGLLPISIGLLVKAEPSSPAHTFWLFVLVAQLAGYALAAAGARARKLGTLARTFVVLNAAAVLGLWRFLTKTQDIAW